MPRNSTLINKAQVRKFALDVAAQTRSRQFTRVSQRFTSAAESVLRNWITQRIESHPSAGVTLK